MHTGWHCHLLMYVCILCVRGAVGCCAWLSFVYWRMHAWAREKRSNGCSIDHSWWHVGMGRQQARMKTPSTVWISSALIRHDHVLSVPGRPARPEIIWFPSLFLLNYNQSVRWWINISTRPLPLHRLGRERHQIDSSESSRFQFIWTSTMSMHPTKDQKLVEIFSSAQQFLYLFFSFSSSISSRTPGVCNLLPPF